MRDYLFRGKTEWNTWVYGSLIVNKNHEYYCILNDDEMDWDYPYLDPDLGTIDGQATPVIPDTIGQYTGVCDKNGTRIFEGDIVRAMMDYGPGGFLESVVDIRYLKLEGYRWEYFDMDTIEVIGNIHDNPELLKGVHDA